MDLDIVVLAAGKGTRMVSEKPKVLHMLGEKPLLSHVLSTALELNPRNLLVVLGHQAELIKKELPSEVEVVLQHEQLGTGHAVKESIKKLDDKGMLLVLFGDVPLLRVLTLAQILDVANENTLAFLSAQFLEPGKLGRVVRNQNGNVIKIVEDADASIAEKEIREINSGVMAIPKCSLVNWLDKLKGSNNQGELYLTDLVEIALSESFNVEAIVCDEPEEVIGINTPWDLAQAERIYQKRKAKELALMGVRIADPERLDIRGNIEVGKDCYLDVNVILEGHVILGDRVHVGAGSIISDSILGSDTKVLAHSVIDGSEIARDCSIGPFSRLRPGTILGAGAKIGNFVETKKALLGPGTKASHLAYLGDAEIGQDTNIGAGTVTCNYDGISKHETRIGDRVFIGTNATLVAPLEIKDDAFVAAGSTITSKVGAKELAFGRAKQKNLRGWVPPSERN